MEGKDEEKRKTRGREGGRGEGVWGGKDVDNPKEQ